MDHSHTAHHLQTTMNSGQGAVCLRRHFLLSLDDLLAVAREFLCPEVSRSGLDRCLRRHGPGKSTRPAAQGDQGAAKDLQGV
jgi:hypothetical protein